MCFSPFQMTQSPGERFRGWMLTCCASKKTTESGGTERVSQTLPPMTGAVADDGVAADDGRVGVDGDVVANGRMPLAADGRSLFITLDVLGEAAGDEADALVKPHAVADLRRAADDHASAVIDEKMRADVGAGMNVDAGAAVRPFGHHAGQEGDAFLVQDMGETEDCDGLDTGIGENDFLLARRRGIALIGGLDIGSGFGCELPGAG